MPHSCCFCISLYYGQKNSSDTHVSITADGANGDTELFEKNSNINGFETFGQQIFLLFNFIKPYIFKAIVEKRSPFFIPKRPYQKVY